jgi:hypothetical protein
VTGLELLELVSARSYSLHHSKHQNNLRLIFGLHETIMQNFVHPIDESLRLKSEAAKQ